MPLRIMQIRVASAHPSVHSRPMQNFDDWVDLTKIDVTQAYFPCYAPDEGVLIYTVQPPFCRFAVPKAQATRSAVVIIDSGRASLLR